MMKITALTPTSLEFVIMIGDTDAEMATLTVCGGCSYIATNASASSTKLDDRCLFHTGLCGKCLHEEVKNG
jgi:hypothetical protein